MAHPSVGQVEQRSRQAVYPLSAAVKDLLVFANLGALNRRLELDCTGLIIEERTAAGVPSEDTKEAGLSTSDSGAEDAIAVAPKTDHVLKAIAEASYHRLDQRFAATLEEEGQ
ncbi:MAG: hypothetical protein SGPRY_014408 [Prymnesium sp.]